MYLENINETHVFSSFGTTFINSQAKDVAKTITFTDGYNLDSNLSFKVLFENGHITSTNTAMKLNTKNIKVYIRGVLSNLPSHQMTVNNATVYTFLQEGTILELYYNGSAFVVVGNPIIYSSDDYEIYANGDFIYKKKSYTTRVSSGTYNVLLGQTSYTADGGQCDVNVSKTCTLTFNSANGTLTATKFCGTASSATNSTCFGGCTYAQACADIRNYTPSSATSSTYSCWTECVCLETYNTNVNKNIILGESDCSKQGISKDICFTFNPSNGVLKICDCSNNVLAGCLCANDLYVPYSTLSCIKTIPTNNTPNDTQSITIITCCNDNNGELHESNFIFNTCCIATGVYYGVLQADRFCGTATCAINSDCFNGCTYAQACADIRNYTPSSATSSTNSCYAEQLKTARSLKVCLSSDTEITFDGTADKTLPTEGVLPVTKGGTGATVVSAITAGRIRILSTDPTSPANGELWILC